MRLIASLIAALALLAETKPEVVDPQGGLIPNARIEELAPGLVRISAPGFETRVLPARDTGRVVLSPAAVRTSLDVVVRDAAPDAPVTGSALEIERTGARTVLDAVERLAPSAFVTRRGVMGYGIATNGTGQISIRGVGGSPNTGVLIVIDGRPDFQGLMGHPLPDFYSLSDAASVTVTQGPASVLYGSNAMGGAVEITPARPEAGFHTRLTSSLGSFLTGQHKLSHGAKFERSYYNFTAGASHTSGDRPGSKFRSQDASTALGGNLGEHWRASLHGRYGFFHVEDPGPLTALLANSYARVGRGGYDLNFDNAYGRSYGYARVYGAYGRHYITDGFRSVDSTNGARAMQSFVVSPALTLDAGGEVNRYGGRARNVAQRLDYGEHLLTEGAAFTRAQWTPHGRLFLEGGFRTHHHSIYGALAVPQANATFRLSPSYAISAGFSRGFRNPTIRELFLFPAPNPGLKPETMWNYQATLSARPSRRLSGWATAYYAGLSNQIVTLGRFPNLALRNAGAALNRGVDSTVEWRPAGGLRLSAGHAWLRSTNLAPLIPAHKFNAQAGWQARRWSVNLGTMTVGRRWANAQRTRLLGGYTLATLQTSFTLRRGLTVFAMADNLLNRSYEVLPGYPMPGANAAGGVTWSF